MYLFLVYDISESNVVKVLKLCRMYLTHVQNSVFEGEITESNLKSLKSSLRKIIDKEKDSVMIYHLRSKSLFKKEILGIEKNSVENII